MSKHQPARPLYSHPVVRWGGIGAVIAGLGGWQVVVPTIDWILQKHTEYVKLESRVGQLEKEVGCLWRIQAKQAC